MEWDRWLANAIINATAGWRLRKPQLVNTGFLRMRWELYKWAHQVEYSDY